MKKWLVLVPLLIAGCGGSGAPAPSPYAGAWGGWMWNGKERRWFTVYIEPAGHIQIEQGNTKYGGIIYPDGRFLAPPVKGSVVLDNQELQVTIDYGNDDFDIGPFTPF